MKRSSLWVILENDWDNHIVFWAVIDRHTRKVLGSGLSNKVDSAAQHAEELIKTLTEDDK